MDMDRANLDYCDHESMRYGLREDCAHESPYNTAHPLVTADEACAGRSKSLTAPLHPLPLMHMRPLACVGGAVPTLRLVRHA